MPISTSSGMIAPGGTTASLPTNRSRPGPDLRARDLAAAAARHLRGLHVLVLADAVHLEGLGLAEIDLLAHRQLDRRRAEPGLAGRHAVVGYGEEEVRRGVMELHPVRTGARVFVGNDAVVPPGQIPGSKVWAWPRSTFWRTGSLIGGEPNQVSPGVLFITFAILAIDFIFYPAILAGDWSGLAVGFVATPRPPCASPTTTTSGACRARSDPSAATSRR
jgi:hypothetical protein